MPKLIRTLAAALLAAFVAAPAAAQVFVDLDTEQIAERRITEAELVWLEGLAMRMDSVLRNEPKALQPLRTEKWHPVSLDSAGRLLEATPALGPELARAGISGRGFVELSWALLHAGVTAEFQPQVLSAAPASIAAANVQLVRANQKRVDHIFAVLTRLMPD